MSDMPILLVEPTMALAAEMLEHWAAKLFLRNAPGDPARAQTVQRQAEEFRAWLRDNPTRAP